MNFIAKLKPESPSFTALSKSPYVLFVKLWGTTFKKDHNGNYSAILSGEDVGEFLSNKEVEVAAFRAPIPAILGEGHSQMSFNF